jgi:hypothetical protein
MLTPEVRRVYEEVLAAARHVAANT